jgi:hypothetical protein
MRRFVDHQGREWDVVVGRGSWGAYLLLFAPTAGSGAVRESPLAASSFDGAMLELDALDDLALITLLERSIPKQD